MGTNDKNAELIYPKESYELIGIAMEIHSKLGNIYKEQSYQKVFEEKLKQKNIPFEREKKVNVKMDDGCEIGDFFLDFVV